MEHNTAHTAWMDAWEQQPASVRYDLRESKPLPLPRWAEVDNTSKKG